MDYYCGWLKPNLLSKIRLAEDHVLLIWCIDKKKTFLWLKNVGLKCILRKVLDYLYWVTKSLRGPKVSEREVIYQDSNPSITTALPEDYNPLSTSVMLLLTHVSGVKDRKLGLLGSLYRLISGPTAERAFWSSAAARTSDKSSHFNSGFEPGSSVWRMVTHALSLRHITLIEMIL